MKQSIWKILIPVAAIIILVGIGLSLVKTQLTPKGASNTAVEIKVGSVVPDFSLQEFNGKSLQLSELPAKVVLINFWATWCEACMVEMPSIIKLRNAYKEKGFEVVAINVDEKPEAALPPVLKEMGFNFPIYTDTDAKISDIFDVHAIPLTVILDKDRKILHVQNGERDWNDDEMHGLLSTWLGLQK